MQRWFFLEDRKQRRYKPPKIESVNKLEEPMAQILSQQWVFTVNAPDVGPREKVFITGNTPELGEWDWQKIVILEHKDGTDLWTKSITIPNTCKVLYRYGISLVDENTNDVVIRQWETSIEPRVIKESDMNPVTDTYGEFNGKIPVTTGWLTTQTLLQFKFMNNPLKLKSRLSERPMLIKVTPVKLSFVNEAQPVDDTSVSADTADSMSSSAPVEVSTLDNDTSLCLLKPQAQFGREYRHNDVYIVNMMVSNFKTLAYLVDIFSYSSHASTDDPPCHVGYTYVLPNMFRPSEGLLELPVTCNIKHRPLGTITIEYLIIHAMSENLNSFQVSYAKYWNENWTGLEVGHRGLGASFKTKGHTIRENTIASLKKAAASGADLLEFDVQLSKDMIPIIYHDFHVCIAMKKKKEIEFSEMLELPVKDLTLEQLQKLKVYHLVEGRNHETLFFDEDLEEHQPFPTLELALETVEPHVGFNVELKWTMEMKDGTFELNHPFDMNTYVDKVLEVVLKYAGERRIVFSCFNPDICTMVRYKQNKYPVMFLTVGITKKYEPYRDPRCLNIPVAVQSAVSTDILGIVVHTEDLLRDPTQVNVAKDAGLIIFCWGDDNNDKDTIMLLKGMGLHAVIYDKLDQYISKTVKESIFLVEARESQRDLMRLAIEEIRNEGSSAQADKSPTGDANPPFLDLLSARNVVHDASTATSLESLASSMDLRDDPSIKNLKRNRNIITKIGKESQLKGQATYFGIYPGCSKEPSKKSRTD